MKNKNYIVHLAGVVAMVFWGMSFVWSTQVYQSLNPTATIFLRLVVATIFFTAILFAFRLNEKIKKEHLGLFALAAMFEPFLEEDARRDGCHQGDHGDDGRADDRGCVLQSVALEDKIEEWL